MTAQIVNFQEVKSAIAEQSLAVSEDDFSIRITSDLDERFWVRLKKTDDHSIVVTDFNGGSLPQMTLNIALRKAVKTLRGSVPKQLTFKNVFQLSEIANKNKDNFDKNLEVVRAACESIATASKYVVSSFRLVQDNRKVNVVVEMS